LLRAKKITEGNIVFIAYFFNDFHAIIIQDIRVKGVKDSSGRVKHLKTLEPFKNRIESC
jgi:hypothetical protein